MSEKTHDSLFQHADPKESKELISGNISCWIFEQIVLRCSNPQNECSAFERCHPIHLALEM
jgi:hypothetical protein